MSMIAFSTVCCPFDDRDNLTVMVLTTVNPLFRRPPRKHLNQESQKSDIVVEDTPSNQPKPWEITPGFTHTHRGYHREPSPNREKLYTITGRRPVLMAEHKHKNDQKDIRHDTQRIPWKTLEEATAGATQNRPGGTGPSVPDSMRPDLLYWRDCRPPTRPFLLASNPVGTFRFNYNTNKTQVGPAVTQRARNTSLQGKIWPI